MPRESQARLRARVEQIRERLRLTYPDARCELNHANPLELLVATILSAQCSDKQVNLVTVDLFQKHRNAHDYAAAPRAELEEDLRRIGLFRNKARSIQGCCRRLVQEHGGEVPDTMDALTQLDGVGRKTANVVLGNAFSRNEGVVVDTHVARLTRRLALTQATQPERIERDLMTLIPREEWTLWSHWLIAHGRRRCPARNPDCTHCELRPWCPTGARPNNHEPPPTDG
jgi:endonuclease III